MAKDKIIPPALCATCRTGLVIGTICPTSDFKDLFAFCGFFRDSPLKFRGTIVTDCTRYKPSEAKPSG